MTARAGLISYDGLPIGSGGGHGLGRLKSEDAWSATLGFLQACTTANSPRRLALSINSVDEIEAPFVDRLVESAVAALGLHASPHDRRQYEGGGRSLIWHLSPEEASAAVGWHDSLGSLRANWLGGLALISADFAFRFRTMAGDRELPYQEAAAYLGQAYDGYGALLGESACRLTLSSRHTLSVLFFLPFDGPSAELVEYVAFLQARLPFRFSPKHWKHWRLSKKGASYVGRRIKSPLHSRGGAA